MAALYRSILLFCILISSSFVSAQFVYDFEEEDGPWQTSDSSLWSISAEEASQGIQSVKFSISEAYSTSALTSIETGYTISKVRTAHIDGEEIIIASSFEGTVLAVSYGGVVLWENKLSGFYNHDVWCDDLMGDDDDEILLANADGSIYCLNSHGELMWDFRPNEAPMNAVTVIHENNIPYVVCGGYDLSFYYLEADGDSIKAIHSSTYSQEKSWGSGIIPPKYRHIINFIRPFKASNGDEHLVVVGSLNQNSASGGAYLFEPMADLPYRDLNYISASPIGDLSIADFNDDGNDDILLGTSNMINDSRLHGLDFATQDTLVQTQVSPADFSNEFDRFGYRVMQPRLINDIETPKILGLFGACVILLDTDLDPDSREVLTTAYAYNDVCVDKGGCIVMASAQSGGSAIHIIDPSLSDWTLAYETLSPPGKIQDILGNTSRARTQLKAFDSSKYPTSNSQTVYFMTEGRDGEGVSDLLDSISSITDRVQFLNGFHVSHVEDWDRLSIPNDTYRNKRDTRKSYDYSQSQAVAMLTALYEDTCGVAHWGGHGNDPYFFDLETRKMVIDQAQGKKTVLIFPELEAYSDEFSEVIDDLFEPLAAYCQSRNANIFIRTKHLFWQSIAHMPLWDILQSGKYSEVFIPAMEETTDKAMDLSVPSRMGFWMSGATDAWGARCARDNTSYNRLRQHSHQMLPNHFLRQMVYNVSNGAQYINNFSVDQQYFSFFWELVASGILYVPQRSDLLSISPVHLSMVEPDEYYLNEGNNVKWLTFFDEEVEENNKLVFSHLNGTWPAAPLTEWDFSRYAAHATERRLNYLPSYENGLVLITPVQAQHYVSDTALRPKLIDQLHPIYKGIVSEYITDGRDYISADGTVKYAAETYYSIIENDIKDKSELLPITVEGDVAWVVAQTSPTHLRLTIIDGGYVNPSGKKVRVEFNSITPIGVVDLLSQQECKLSFDGDLEIDIPCGLFKFIDVELLSPLQ